MSPVDRVVLKHLGDSNGPRAVVFVLMCAERVRPLVAVFGSARANVTVNVVLDAAWGSLTGEGMDAKAGEQAIRALPEAAIDDSNEPSYYSMIALGLVVDAIHATSGASADLVTSASSGMRDLARDLRLHQRYLTASDNRLDELEIAAETEAAERLGSLRPEDLPGALVSLRELARQRGSAFAEAAQTLAAAWT